MAIAGLHEFILYCIEIHGAFAFPELGTLRIERVSAKYTIDRKHILPPFTQLSFSSIYEAKFDLTFLGKMAGIEGKVMKRWVSEIQEFVSDQNTEKKPQLNLNGLGTFTKENGETKFLTLTNSQNPSTNYLYPTLSIQPLPIPFHTIEFAVENPKKLIIPGREKQQKTGNLIFPILIICIVGLFICLRSCFEVDKDNGFPPIVQNDIKVSNSKKEATEQSIFDTSVEEGYVSDTLRIDSVVKASQNTKVKENKPQTNNSPAIVPQDSICIYVVGAFQKKNNAVQLKKKLNKEGLSTEIYQSGKFYRVGISLSCSAESSYQLSNLQLRFPDIWVLE